MKTYEVKVPRTITQVITIVAHDCEDAIEKAYQETSIELMELINEGRAFIDDYYPAEGYEINVREGKPE